MRSQLSQRETALADLCRSVTPKPSPTQQRHITSSVSLQEDQTPSLREEQEEEEQGRSSSDTLVAMGHRCLGDNHQKVIESQRHALHDMRRRMDDLMMTHPPGNRPHPLVISSY